MTDLQVRAGTVANMSGPAKHPYADPPLLETIDNTCRMLQQCRSTINKLIRNGRLESVCIGRRRMVKRRSILRLVREVE